jgi:hypothetical protein
VNNRFAIPAALLIAGCSSPTTGSNDSNARVATQKISELAASGTNATAALKSGALTVPYFIQVQPGMHCKFSKPGPASRAESIDADENGKVHFFPPPQTWGSLIDVQCSAGSVTTRVSIDLNDPSTFSVDTDLAAQQKTPGTSVRPALTGDLAKMPMSEILHGGYPPRPDAARAPERYKKWLEIVSAPHVVRDVKMVKALGYQAGNYVSTVVDTQESFNAWAGRAFDVNGWTAEPMYTDFPIAPNENDTSSWYVQYDTYMTVPPWLDCDAHDNCYGAEWAGMGGMEPRAGVTDSSLVQSGIYFTNVNGTPSQNLFVEYAPDSPWISLPGSFAMNAGDNIEAWGWVSSDTSCSDINVTSWTPVGCFNFYNLTTAEYVGYYYYYTLPPADSKYYGWTYESIIEDQHALGAMLNYGYVVFNDYAYGADANYHNAFTDPWIYINSSDTGPSNLINVVPSTTDDEWEYEVDWVNYR